jgi:uncharacterized protein YjbI with pentapeptide repeats
MSETSASTDIRQTSAPPKIGIAWGDDISEERQRELDAILAFWDSETDHGRRRGPFHNLQELGVWSPLLQMRLELTGADVYYLAARALVGTTASYLDISDLPTARTALRNPNLRFDLDLSALCLSGANLAGAQLEQATLGKAQLIGATLSKAQLTGANLAEAQLAEANLSEAQLTDSSLSKTTLERAKLDGAQLTNAFLSEARLTGADLNGVQLTGAILLGAQLAGADLRFARLDRDTQLNGAHVAGVSLDQIVLDNTNLTVVSWEGVAPLGDEKRARSAKQDGPLLSLEVGRFLSDHGRRIVNYEAAVRANRLLATALRAQGLAEDADVFAYRAQIMQRGLRFRRRQFGRWLVSWGLAALSGYGYRMGNIFRAYALVVLAFAAAFLLPIFLAGGIPTIQNAADALQISLNAIHGRVFFAQFHLDTLQSWLATAESVVGIVIEGVFVAMLIQRLFR